MCLNDVGERKVAERDIVCYKLVHGHYAPHYRTMYRRDPVHIGKSYRSKFRFRWNDPEYHIIEQGLHSLAYKKDALRWKSVYGVCNLHIVKCIIPKGSLYYVGTYDIPSKINGVEYVKSYASNRIKYLELCV